MKRFLATPLFFVLAALAFVGCNDDNDGPQIRTIGFEQAALGTDGFIWGKDHATEQDDTDWQGQPMKSNLYYGSDLHGERGAVLYLLYGLRPYIRCVERYRNFEPQGQEDRRLYQ